MSECRSCGAKIFWVRMAPSGGLAPIDEKPSPDGNVVLTSINPPKARVIHKSEADPPKVRYLNHFASCPNAPSHRKG